MTIASTIFRLCVIWLIAAGSSAFAAPQTESLPSAGTTPPDPAATATISGRVVLPSGSPVSERIRITLSTLNDPGLGLYTDTNGEFIFTGLRQGTYYLEAAGDPRRFEPVVEQVRVFRGVQVRLTMYLREREGASENRRSGAVIAAGEADASVPEAARNEFKWATRLANEGEPEGAIERYRKALEIYPRYLMARNDLGVQLLNLGRTVEAAEEFGAAIEISPTSFNPRLNLGIALIEQARFVEALDQLNVAASIDSSSAAVHLYLGVASVALDHLDAAERELAKALSLGGPDFAVCHYHMGQVHMKRGQREHAIKELQTYLETQPDGQYAASARGLLAAIQ